MSKEEIKKGRDELKSQYNILWYHTTWHSGSFKILKKAFDFLWGMLLSLYLLFRYRVTMVYSEGFPGAIIGHYLSILSRKPHVVHTFEPHADYMIEARVWSRESWEARFLKKMQGKVAKGAYAVLTATEAYISQWRNEAPNTRFYRVPSCVDTDFFSFSEQERVYWRKQWGITEQEVLLVYLGKIGGMYWEEELLDLYKTFCSSQKFTFRLVVISPQDSTVLPDIQSTNVIWLSGERKDIPGWLSACDLAISAIRPIPSRRFSSPIKHGEYWAIGLPVIVPAGISDDYLLVEEKQIGYVLPSLDDKGYRKVLTEVEEKLDRHDAKRAVDFATNDRDVKGYSLLYKDLFMNNL
ncbi:hypothetical protein QWY31_04575 [Cytophagales bacterium LB-30]|uniref:Glycosyltransferase family 4 protein n=1 Tax=Shiella aurantiaca TaxID=3058365 RepID=A0ABT8F380_9BACT|nr:hypothetical protein [Shiella aurantiaca]MDN4164763.1 hypothetical protein [Shiella aurantiaca]